MSKTIIWTDEATRQVAVIGGGNDPLETAASHTAVVLCPTCAPSLSAGQVQDKWLCVRMRTMAARYTDITSRKCGQFQSSALRIAQAHRGHFCAKILLMDGYTFCVSLKKPGTAAVTESGVRKEHNAQICYIANHKILDNGPLVSGRSRIETPGKRSGHKNA